MNVQMGLKYPCCHVSMTPLHGKTWQNGHLLNAIRLGSSEWWAACRSLSGHIGKASFPIEQWSVAICNAQCFEVRVYRQVGWGLLARIVCCGGFLSLASLKIAHLRCPSSNQVPLLLFTVRGTSLTTFHVEVSVAHFSRLSFRGPLHTFAQSSHIRKERHLHCSAHFEFFSSLGVAKLIPQSASRSAAPAHK